MSSEEMLSIHDVHDGLDSGEACHKTTYILQFLCIVDILLIVNLVHIQVYK